MLSSPVSVHDIKDVESFVRSMVPKTRLKLQDAHEREELIAEGIAILFDLAAKFKPHMAGYEKPGSFAGYCSKYLPYKMAAAWHHWHPEHLLESERQDDGTIKKRYHYGESVASFDEQLERDENVDSDRLRTVGNFVRS